MTQELTPDILLRAYQAGVFPMSDGRDDNDVFWVDPRKRGVMPLNGFHISRSLAKRIRRADFTVRIDTNFSAVVQACANRDETWISTRIEDLYTQLHARGFAHSVEIYDSKGQLFGGVYGVAIASAFFGESMFSTQPEGSKIALAYLVDRLRLGGYTLFDTQFITPHLASLGAVEIARSTYRNLLEDALQRQADFWALGRDAPTAHDVLQRNAQTS